MTAYVLTSDVHLRSVEEPLFAQWVSTIDAALQSITASSKQILILGDLWDLHIAGHATFDSWPEAFRKQIAVWKEKGVNFAWFEGNHDLYFPEADHILASGDHQFYVCHGDRLNSQDRAYLRWKKFLHLPTVRTLARHLPSAWVRHVGTRLSQKSRTEWVGSKTWGWEVYQQEIAARAPKLLAEGVRTFIFGHCHWKKDETIGGLRVVNLGYFPQDQAVFVIQENNAYWVQNPA